MAKASEKYEVMYIINPNCTEEQTAELVEKFKALVEANGTLEELEEWASASWPMKSTISPKATMC